MLELKKISNEVLVKQLKNLVVTERRILTDVLWHLCEVEERRIHLSEGYASVFEYCVQVLGYSSSQAYRRIAAMRLMREVPQMEASLESGKLNLTHLTLAQEYFREEKKLGNSVSETQKIELLSSLENKSTREAEKVIHTLSPGLVLKEKERVITQDLTEIRFIANEGLLQKLKQFKEMDSHVQVNPNYAELFERLVDLALKVKEPQIKQKKATLEKPTSAPKKESKNQRFIPAQIKREALKRDQGVCTFKNPTTGKSCRSKFQIQIDHLVPVARGGKSTLENLRVLCATHNRFEGERVLGKQMMNQFSAPKNEAISS